MKATKDHIFFNFNHTRRSLTIHETHKTDAAKEGKEQLKDIF